MGLALVQVNTWHSVRPEKYKRGSGHTNYVAYGDYYLLNTNRMVDIRTTTAGGTIFKYNQAPNDHRCSPDTIETTNTLEVIKSYVDAAEDSKFGIFPIFPAFDTTETPVDTEIEWIDVCMIYQTTRDFEDGVAHMVYYDKSWKRRMCMINMNIIAVLAMEYV